MSPVEYWIRKALQHYGAILQVIRAQKHYPIILTETKEQNDA